MSGIVGRADGAGTAKPCRNHGWAVSANAAAVAGGAAFTEDFCGVQRIDTSTA